MNYNFHTHTKRCGHAEGTDEEYILNAIENGIEYLGFSDHSPYRYPDGFEAHYRVPLTGGKDYIRELNELREKYKDKIDIKIGFEMEYYPEHFDEMLKTAKDLGAEYLILGQHFIPAEHPNGFHTCKNAPDPKLLEEYVNCVIKGIESGVFTYVAHPDMIDYKEDEDFFCQQMKKICIASKKYNVPVEINFNGIRCERHYPNELFWKIAGEEGCPVTFGSDAHNPKHTFDGESLEKAKQLVEKYNLNYIGKPEIINIR